MLDISLEGRLQDPQVVDTKINRSITGSTKPEDSMLVLENVELLGP